MKLDTIQFVSLEELLNNTNVRYVYYVSYDIKLICLPTYLDLH